MIQRLAYVFLTFITIALIGGCGTNLGRNLEKTIDSTKEGLTDSKTNIEDQLSKSCQDTLKVSDDADEVLRLVSSEDNTLFIVDGKEMGRAKQLKVCINSKAKHTVVAKPDGCDEKTEKMQPPYDFPIYEFRFMLAECKGTPSPAPTPPTKPKKPKHSSQSS